MKFASLRRRERLCTMACLLLFVIALSRYWVFDRTEVVSHNIESLRLATNIAERGRFANPFSPLDTGPSAHMAPGFPAMLAILICLFGDGRDGMYAIKLSAAIVLSVFLALFPIFSKALGMGYLNGIIAAAIWIAAKVGLVVLPNGHQAVAMFFFESFYVAIPLAFAVCWFWRYLDSPVNRPKWLAWFIGGAIGVSMLISPTVVTIYIGLFGLVLFAEKFTAYKRPDLWIIVLLPLILATPWTIRNFLTFNRLIFLRDNFGLELSVSNNDCASFGFQRNIETGCFAKEHPNANLEEAGKVLTLGEVKYNDLKLREAEDWIKTHPATFVRLCALRTAAFWMPPPYSLHEPGRRLERFTIYLMTLLSAAGLFMLFRRDSLSAVVCLTCLVLFPIVYYIVQYEYRYRYPILWITFLLGSLPITTVAQRTYNAVYSGRRGGFGTNRGWRKERRESTQNLKP
jgi:hypothetical protein